jgi:glycosyltransferase involved in cell wall biosynthesis
VIPTGIDLNRFRPDISGGSIRGEFNINEKVKVISIIGMIRPDKGQKCFIRAIDGISDIRPDVRFLIVGSATKPEYLEDVKAEISKLHHRDKVHLTGFRRDIEHVIATSDVVVNSCSYEPMSQVIHQAFAMRKPVVASDAEGHLKTVRNGKTGFLFRSMDAESLSKTVLSVLDNHTEQIRMRAYHMALSELGIDTMMEKTLSVYRTTLAARQSRQS